jgi:hypothetical protein
VNLEPDNGLIFLKESWIHGANLRPYPTRAAKPTFRRR